MRKSYGNILTLLVALVLSTSAYSSGWSGVSTVERIYALDNHRVLIKLSDFANPDNCSTDSNGDVIINSETHSNWFSMLLAAYMSGKTVDIYVASTCTTIWADTSYADVGHVRLR
ncbi:hypothetical protein FKG94_01570 [Exilibacterium tricleocarpae]|uniref:Uncharacterized protein n=1 Tax=Exilibacterium tricleocarpae TaxID=2591008 RepID=A0A545U9X5_9GAMM|nr:hypothetical protein FKG94_01570 [Exilibacterium tricleocarpae]